MSFELVVGKEVWFDDALANRPRPRAVEITKVGHKWVTAGKGWAELRFDKETLQVDGGRYSSSPGKIWPDEESWRVEVQRWRLWSTVRATMPFFGPPPGVSAVDVVRAAVLMGLVKGDGTLEDATAKLEELAKR